MTQQRPQIAVGLEVQWRRGMAHEGQRCVVTEIDAGRHWVWLNGGKSGCHVADFWKVFVLKQ